MKLKFAFATALLGIGVACFTACSDDSSSNSSNGTGSVSCYTYNTVSKSDNEVREACVQAEKGSSYADSVEKYCKVYATFMEGSDEDWAELGDGCPTDKKAAFTCTDARLGSDVSGVLTSIYYTLDEEQKALVVKDDEVETCLNLKKEAEE